MPRVGKVGPVVVLEGEQTRTDRWSDVADLVLRAQDGDRDAFGQLVEQFQPTVYSIAQRRLGNASEALELTQEVFLHALRRIHQLREPERFAGWLRQMAVRMAINQATRRVAPTAVENSVLEGACERTGQPLDELIRRERAERLWAAMGRLRALDRETLIAFYVRGLSLVEMAEELMVPLGTIKRRLHTARKRLRAELESSVANADEWTSGSALDGTDPEDPCDSADLVASVSASAW
jgi:RNA polymerase sigma-70 factor (ECF subfamily)